MPSDGTMRQDWWWNEHLRLLTETSKIAHANSVRTGASGSVKGFKTFQACSMRSDAASALLPSGSSSFATGTSMPLSSFESWFVEGVSIFFCDHHKKKKGNHTMLIFVRMTDEREKKIRSKRTFPVLFLGGSFLGFLLSFLFSIGQNR